MADPVLHWSGPDNTLGTRNTIIITSQRLSIGGGARGTHHATTILATLRDHLHDRLPHRRLADGARLARLLSHTIFGFIIVAYRAKEGLLCPPPNPRPRTTRRSPASIRRRSATQPRAT